MGFNNRRRTTVYFLLCALNRRLRITFNFSCGLRKTVFSARVRFGHSRSSKVIDFDVNRKRVCDFLLVRHYNLGHILHRFRNIAGFCARDRTLFHPNFWGVPVGPDRPCWGQPEHKP